ncbi:hypothetical protein [Brucella thiophenivorans]|uniref:hypothetical protein n=1 Tax=Brucella thiophenivorans TaxID=571255 RepID=UPI00117E3CBC|nr:hypothetical protein [Brucella thiophenivorans]
MFRSNNDILSEAKLRAASNSFAPSVVLKCKGLALFRSQRARNLACYFDLSPDVVIWTCMPVLLGSTQAFHIPDFAVQRVDGDYLVDIQNTPDWALKSAEAEGWVYDERTYRMIEQSIISNAVDLLPFASSTVSLGDRLRLLSVLDDDGPLPLKHCCELVRNTNEPMSALAALYFSGEISFDLTERISPETRVSRT